MFLFGFLEFLCLFDFLVSFFLCSSSFFVFFLFFQDVSSARVTSSATDIADP